MFWEMFALCEAIIVIILTTIIAMVAFATFGHGRANIEGKQK